MDLVNFREEELRIRLREQSAQLISDLVDAGEPQRVSMQFMLADHRQAFRYYRCGDYLEVRGSDERSRPELRLIGIEEMAPRVSAFVSEGDEILAEGLRAPQEGSPFGGSDTAVALLVFFPRPTGTRGVYWEFLTHGSVELLLLHVATILLNCYRTGRGFHLRTVQVTLSAAKIFPSLSLRKEESHEAHRKHLIPSGT